MDFSNPRRRVWEGGIAGQRHFTGIDEIGLTDIDGRRGIANIDHAPAVPPLPAIASAREAIHILQHLS